MRLPGGWDQCPIDGAWGASEKRATGGEQGMRTSMTLALIALMLVLGPLTAAPVAAQGAAPERVVLPTDRTVLPIPEPTYPHSTVFDVRNATPPPRFEVKAPAGAQRAHRAHRRHGVRPVERLRRAHPDADGGAP